MPIAIAQLLRQRHVRNVISSSNPDLDVDRILRESTRLMTLIQDFQDLEYSDKRDQVFAVLGLATDELARLNPPAYEMTLRQVHTRLSETWISNKGNLDILNMCWNVHRTPSWVVQFDESANPCVVIHSYTTETPIYHASSGSRPEVQLIGESSGDEQEIQISGFCFDHVVDSTDKLPGNIQQISPTIPELKYWKGLATSISVDEESFWYAMSIDQDVFTLRRRTADEREELRRDIKQWLDSGSTEWPSTAFRDQLKRGLYGHLFTTSNQRLGFCWTRGMLHTNDQICILFGGQTPFILRPRPDGCYTLVGECYMPGMMDGEAMIDYEAGKHDKTVFRIF